MPECWLKPNRRPAYVVLSLAVLIAAGSAAGLVYAWTSGRVWLSIAAMVVGAIGVVVALLNLRDLRKPRVSYADGQLFVHDGSPSSHAVPIDIVEVFFLGSGPVKDGGEDNCGPRTANVVIRLAETAKDWHEGRINPLIGKWSEGYIVLRGTWCEPIGHSRLNEMNHRLAEVRRQRRQQAEEQPEVTT